MRQPISGGLVVFAKSPRAGSVKTRLTPQLTPSEAAWLARACLQDTLDAVLQAKVPRPVLALEGPAGDWLPPGFRMISQRGASFQERLHHAFEDAGTPGLLIGMDTPQVSRRLLEHAWATLLRPSVDAVLGPALDGGWWALGLREVTDVFDGIPTSTAATGRLQLKRLRDLGMRVEILPTLRDLDCPADIAPLVAAAPRSRFATEVRRLRRTSVVG